MISEGPTGEKIISPNAKTPKPSGDEHRRPPTGRTPAEIATTTQNDDHRHSAAMPSIRVRDRPSIRLSTQTCATTMTRVLTKNTTPIALTGRSATVVMNAGRPASIEP